MSEIRELNRRLQRLERENLRLKRTGIMTLVAAASLLVVGFAGPEDRTVEAERFVLRGADGTEAATLAIDKTGSPYLLMRKQRASAMLTLSGPGLQLRGDDGRTSAFLGMQTDGSSMLSLSGKELVDGARVRVSDDGSVGFYALNGGQERAALEASTDGSANVSVRGKGGDIRGMIGIGANEAPGFVLFDEYLRQRAGMVVEPGGGPVLEMLDETSAPRARMKMKFDGSTSLEFLRADGGSSWRAP
jgi:hypothetical protein